jgi:peptidoglycan/xylan/chitin deacetylase (PgdA/CDA1 family)
VRLRAVVRQLSEMIEVPRDLVLRRYPPFVTGGPLPSGDVPVFCFHSLDPTSFAEKMSHLVRNGYVTLSGTEYMEVIGGRRPAPEKAVLLTFDDGRSSVRTVGWPIMRRHGLKGVVFIVPGRIASRPGPLPPTWDDVERGGVEPKEILDRESGEEAFLTWEEIAALRDTGLFEFESHTHTHAQVHVGPGLQGFMVPSRRLGYAPLEVPLVHALGGHDLLAPDVPLGTPLLRSDSRLSERRRFIEDPASRLPCVERVRPFGASYFRRPGWERELRALRGRPPEGRLESRDEQVQAIRHELAEARRAINAQLESPARHICYPKHIVGPTARQLVREVGYEGAFCGKVPGVPITRSGGDPHAIARVGEDYVELLPGRGRGRLVKVLAAKWKRRLHPGSPS